LAKKKIFFAKVPLKHTYYNHRAEVVVSFVHTSDFLADGCQLQSTKRHLSRLQSAVGRFMCSHETIRPLAMNRIYTVRKVWRLLRNRWRTTQIKRDV
jgi:hypothetical protein